MAADGAKQQASDGEERRGTVAGPNKFQIRAKNWDVGVLIGSLAVLLFGFGGLFLLQSTDSAGSPTLLFVVLLGLVTFALFAGPGIVYVLRKRNAWVKAKLPGGTMPWIRSHLYLPITALVAAFVHATVVPFRANLSSGKALLVVGVLVSIAGVCRHHLIGVQKAALNVNVAISKITTGQSRAFRRLVADFTDTGRPVGEIDAEMSQLDPQLQERWAKIKALSADSEKHFPRTGGQKMHIRQFKLWRALHPPLTVLLFVVLGFHMWDVLGGTDSVFKDDTAAFASSATCAGCHSRNFVEWGASSMAHAQTSTITQAQLPVTLAENRKLSDAGSNAAGLAVGQSNQTALFNASVKVCTTCHAQVGARFAKQGDALFPLDASGTEGVKATGTAVSGGDEAVQSDGVGCIVCHSMAKPLAELAGGANFPLDSGSLGDYGTQYGPLFSGPNPLPQRAHGIDNSDLWADPIQTSQVCGTCHNVKLDIAGDGVAKDPSVVVQDPAAPVPDTTLNGLDTSLTPITNAKDAAKHDKNGNLQLDENETSINDVVLQTTYDEWQDYVGFYDAGANADGIPGFKARYSNLDTFANPNDSALGCSDCHMPVAAKDDRDAPVVDHAPGVLPRPEREYHSHTFVGVDYDLDPAKYQGHGLPADALDKALAEREALIRSAVTLKVTNDPDRQGFQNIAQFATQNGETGKLLSTDVDVRNNLLAHTFPTGFAFARQFYLEVSAKTKGGDPICLSVPFVNANGSVPVSTPCASGLVGNQKAGKDPSASDTEQDLPQCDPTEVLASFNGAFAVGGKGTDVVIPNEKIKFADGATASNDKCDPWLTNFQKILTDGDPGQTGIANEVPWQSFVPNLVQIRGRIADGTPVKDLQPVRLAVAKDGTTSEQETGIFNYMFFVPDRLLAQGVTADDIVVTATMRFRHLPPYFVRGLAQAQKDIKKQGFNVPAGADITDSAVLDDLLSHLSISTVGQASSGETETLGCDQGPQNESGGTILACLDASKTPQFTVKGTGFANDGSALPAGAPSDNVTAASPIADRSAALSLASGGLFLSMSVPFGLRRRRRGRATVQ